MSKRQTCKPASYVFVTVGTTSFDELIKTVTSQSTCAALKSRGYSRLLLQIGRGDFEPTESTVAGVSVEYYRYKDSLVDDVTHASLVISHAGAGSVMEALRLQRPLVVVINDVLMGNHQVELAAQLAADGHLHYTTCHDLEVTLLERNFCDLVPYVPGNPRLFGMFIDQVMALKRK